MTEIYYSSCLVAAALIFPKQCNPHAVTGPFMPVGHKSHFCKRPTEIDYHWHTSLGTCRTSPFFIWPNSKRKRGGVGHPSQVSFTPSSSDLSQGNLPGALCALSSVPARLHACAAWSLADLEVSSDIWRHCQLLGDALPQHTLQAIKANTSA